MTIAVNKSNGFPELAIDLKLRAGNVVVEPGAGRMALLSAIEDSNRKARLNGLPDHLDPEIIEPEKAEAFIKGLSRLPTETLRPLAGRTLFLNHPELMIGASAPTTTETFNLPFKIEITDVQGEVVLVRALVQLDCALARARASEARARLDSTAQDVKGLEARLPVVSGTPEQERETLVALSTARLRCFAAARAWEQNAKAWANCADAGSAAKADHDAASQAVVRYAVLRPAGMP